jgi:hypothetical protein
MIFAPAPLQNFNELVSFSNGCLSPAVGVNSDIILFSLSGFEELLGAIMQFAEALSARDIAALGTD